MRDHLDVPLEDGELMGEVELVSALIIAASESEGRLDDATIDKVLGVECVRPPAQQASGRHESSTHESPALDSAGQEMAGQEMAGQDEPSGAVSDLPRQKGMSD